MRLSIATSFSCTADALWQRIIEPRSLVYVAAPLLKFVPVDGGQLPARWEVGEPYALRLYLLKWLPLGRHTIRLVTIDEATHTIVSEERGHLARVWNHIIRFHEVASGRVHYCDEIDIRAGLLTLLIWLFAQVFYRHRQRRWKRLLRQGVNGAAPI